jgi:hypothetical protein
MGEKLVKSRMTRQKPTLQAFNQVTNRHPRGHGVRIDDNIWGDSFARKRHILLKAFKTL